MLLTSTVRMRLVSDNSSSPDWGVIGTAIGTTATALAAIIVGVRGTLRNGKSPNVPSIDHTAQTLDSVFKLIDELQAENARKSARIIELEQELRESRQRRPRG